MLLIDLSAFQIVGFVLKENAKFLYPKKVSITLCEPHNVQFTKDQLLCTFFLL